MQFKSTERLITTLTIQFPLPSIQSHSDISPMSTRASTNRLVCKLIPIDTSPHSRMYRLLFKSLPQKFSKSNMSLYSFSWISTILDSLQFACCLGSQSICLMSHASLSNIQSGACNKLVMVRPLSQQCQYLAYSPRFHAITNT